MNSVVFVILNHTLCVTVASFHYEMVTCKNDGKSELMRLIATEV